ncbi:MFS transporter [Actinocrinis sp.]|uniref:MFS transporter n=1 Tax=Actinocrinis sp. TaxID=1920516 RepID=UPI002C30CFAF|nr:MFS transporter [Actinocrinis sp.]HXR70751.1 MFS transporter [Actinocrinis sp.]
MPSVTAVQPSNVIQPARTEVGYPIAAPNRVTPRHASPGRLRPLLPDSVAFYLQASIVVAFLAASSAPTPLYARYQAAWHFSPITTTVVFGSYALAVLGALLTVGSLSDHVGRRPVLITAIGLQAASMLVFITAGSVSTLMMARIVQGIATGGALGAVGAGLLDVDRAKGTITNAVAPLSGTAAGALLSGVLVQYLPAPEHLVYLVLFAIFAAQAIGVALMRETSARESGALASLRPQFGVPRAARGPVLKSLPVLIALWALAGFYGSVGPAVVGLVTGSHSPVLGGLPLFVMGASGGVAVLLLRGAPARTVMLLGTAWLLAGVGVTLLGMETRSSLAFFIGAVIAGAGFGAGFQGAIRTVVPLAAPHERSGLLSAVYVVSYLALGLPAVGGGFLVVHGGLLPAAREYGVAVMVLAAIALGAVARPSRRVVTAA